MTPSKWIQLAREACAHAGIEYGDIEILTTWEQQFTDSDNFRHNAVLRIGHGRCLKIYGDASPRPFQVEHTLLGMLNNHPSIPAPRLIASGATAGTLDNRRPYLIMSEVSGTTLQRMWDTLTRDALLRLAREIGTITAEIHRLPVESLARIEAEFGGREAYYREQEAERIAEINTIPRLSSGHRDELLDFLRSEAKTYLEDAITVTHADLSWAHIYVDRADAQVKISSVIDWAEAMLAPPEWDVAFNWFWTFSQDRGLMREYLHYADIPRPAYFARRCFATHLYSFSMGEVWDYFTDDVPQSASIVDAMVRALFPPDVFGTA